jgi:hypothetical protein
VERLQVPEECREAYAALQGQLQTLNPVKLLASPTNLVRQMRPILDTLLTTIKQMWQTLTTALSQGRDRLQALASAEAVKALLSEVIDAFAKGPLQVLAQRLEAPLTGIKKAVDAFLGLQKHLDALNTIPDSMTRVGDAILGVKDTLLAFNLDFLTGELQGLMDTVMVPLQALNPQMFLDELMPIYTRVLGTLQSLNPAQIIACARGTLTPGVCPHRGAPGGCHTGRRKTF